MKKNYIKPTLTAIHIHAENPLAMSFANGPGYDYGNASLYNRNVSDDTESWDGAW